MLPPAQSQADAGTTSRRWYGWQTLSLDVASLTIGAIGVKDMGEPGSTSILMGSIGITGYTLGAPFVHWVHGQPGKAASSLGLRIVLPLIPVGLLSASSAARCPGANEEDDAQHCRLVLRTMAVLGTVGMLVASGVDASALSWEPEVRQRGTLALAPLLGWDGGRGGVAGVAGLF
ncbi:MAG TPA: hypothetical protein VJN18_12315 [Polyangiaceae bacterium]|nr:hypothetical protein [Polyangiaceae bacterium]